MLQVGCGAKLPAPLTSVAHSSFARSLLQLTKAGVERSQGLLAKNEWRSNVSPTSAPRCPLQQPSEEDSVHTGS